MSKPEDGLYDQLEKGTVCKTLAWLRDETVGEGNEYIYNQFDLVLDILTQAGWK